MQVHQEKPCIFSELEGRLDALEQKDALKTGRDRGLILLMLGGMAMTIPSMIGVKDPWVSWVVLAGLVVEMCALGVLTYRQMRDVAPEFIDAKRKFAEELDGDFFEKERLLAWLRSLPAEERTRRLAYIESRLESMALRYSMVFGAVDKLGFLPLLVGLFLQMQAIDSVSMMTGIFGLLILVLYGMSLWMARFRLQMQSYAQLLRAA